VKLPDGVEATDLAMLAYDDEFLFVALRCNKVPGHFYNQRPRPRAQDPELDNMDRVEIWLDVDRDYGSAFQWVVDHRGCGAESCCGSVDWNPDWYIEQFEDDQNWNIELAIPLGEITPGPIAANDVWAISLSRLSYDSTHLWVLPEDGLSQPNERIRPGAQTGMFTRLLSRPDEFELFQFQ
jgi:hypothetical protein